MKADRLEFVAASPGHVGRVANRMREWDRLEQLAGGREPKAALRLALRGSIWAVTALVDNVPHAMFGVMPISEIEDRGAAWFLGSDLVYQHGRDLVRYGPAVLARMHKSYGRLENSVAVGNVQAIRLLRRWGFHIGAAPYKRGDLEFVHFWRERECAVQHCP